MRSLEHRDCALDVRREGVKRLLDYQLDADRRGEVNDDVTAANGLVNRQFVKHRSLDEAEAWIVLDRVKIDQAPRRERIEDDDLVPGFEQRLCQVRTDEASTAGDQIARHERRLLAPTN